MKPLFIFTFRSTAEEIKIAHKWGGLTGSKEIIHHQIPQKNPAEVLGNEDVVVSFGRTARHMVEQVDKKLHHVVLPSIQELAPTESNENKRAWAATELEGIKSLLQADKEIVLLQIDTDKI